MWIVPLFYSLYRTTIRNKIETTISDAQFSKNTDRIFEQISRHQGRKTRLLCVISLEEILKSNNVKHRLENIGDWKWSKIYRKIRLPNFRWTATINQSSVFVRSFSRKSLFLKAQSNERGRLSLFPEKSNCDGFDRRSNRFRITNALEPPLGQLGGDLKEGRRRNGDEQWGDVSCSLIACVLDPFRFEKRKKRTFSLYLYIYIASVESVSPCISEITISRMHFFHRFEGERICLTPFRRWRHE